MKTRIITAVIALPIFIFLLYMGGIYRFAVTLLLSLVGTFELSQAFNQFLDVKVRILLLLIFDVIIEVVMKVNADFLMPLMALSLIVIFCFEVLGAHADPMRAVASVFTLMYVSVPFGFLSLFDTLPNGTYYLWLVFVVAFVTDTAAYFVGRALGKTKLKPKISPKKTVAGAVGGVVFAVIGCVVYGLIMAKFFSFSIPWYLYIPLGLIGSIVAQCGDLSASVIKRKAGLKDYGKLLPGHGGVLDRFDAAIFVIPIVYLFGVFTSTLLVQG